MPADKSKVHNEQSVPSVSQRTPEYKIDNRTVYDILNQICKDTDLYSYVKQHKFKTVGRGAFYGIHSRWLSPNHINATVSEAEMALQTSTFDCEKKAWKWEKYVAQHVKYHIIMGNLMENGYQGIDTGSKVRYLLNGIRCDKFSLAITAVTMHPDKYEKNLDSVVTFLTQYINKISPTPSMKIASVAHNRPTKWQKTCAGCGTFKGKIE